MPSKSVKKHQANSFINIKRQDKQDFKSTYDKFWVPLLLIITFVVYFASLKNDFVFNWDDNIYLLHNPYIQKLNATGIKNIFTTFHAGNYHPLTTLTYAIELKMWGLNAEPFHILNLILHLINVVLIFIFFRLLLQKDSMAFLIALLFAIHPLHVESVAWISERKDVLYTLFYFASLIFYIKYQTKEKSWLNYFFALGCFFLSLLSKSMAISLPLVLILIDYYRKRKFSYKLIWEKLPFFALSGLFGILAIFSQKASGSIYHFIPFAPTERFFLICYSLVFYIWKLFLPTGLSALHFYPDKIAGMLPWFYYVTPLILIGLGILTFIRTRFRKEFLFGFLFYLVTVGPVIQLVPVGQYIVAERYSYVPHLGLIFILVVIFFWYYQNKAVRKTGFKQMLGIAGVIFLFFLGISTYKRTLIWKDGITLFSDVIRKNPDNAMGYNVRGNEKLRRKDYYGALADFNETVKRNPKYADALHNRGVAKYNLKDYHGAIQDYSSAINIQQKNPNLYYSRGLAKYEAGDQFGAISDYNKVIEITGNYMDVYNNRGVSKGILEQYDSAISDFNKALEYNPKNANAFFNRANALLMLQNTERACIDYQKAFNLGHKGAASMLEKVCNTE